MDWLIWENLQENPIFHGTIMDNLWFPGEDFPFNQSIEYEINLDHFCFLLWPMGSGGGQTQTSCVTQPRDD